MSDLLPVPPVPAAITAKTTTLFGQIFTAVWATGWFSYLFIRFPEFITPLNILLSAVAIPASFTPIFSSIFLDKIKEIQGIKFGKDA